MVLDSVDVKTEDVELVEYDTSPYTVEETLHPLPCRTPKSETLFRCEFCECNFFQSYHLTEHQHNHTDEEEEPYDCNYCSRTVAQDLHMIGESDGDLKPFMCLLCKMPFRHRGDLYEHRAFHKEKSHFEVCIRSSSSYNYLTRHMLQHTK
ncbi:zinc finger protein 530-like isoform X1 [Ornithodoros turicata]|uniref:zinc finger protein 530-like isoform X1 n=1 Tax=Ornithodoros turicata TaxID=34597 RepID=UPI003139BB20